MLGEAVHPEKRQASSPVVGVERFASQPPDPQGSSFSSTRSAGGLEPFNVRALKELKENVPGCGVI